MTHPIRNLCLLATALVAGLLTSLAPTGATGEQPPKNRYIGAKACKNCHQAEPKGDQYGKWSNAGHSHAFEALASEHAKKIATERGIEDAQKSEQCLPCHSTAFGVDEKLIKKGFEATAGVQCESCHGPGEEHFKKQSAAAMSGKVDPAVYKAPPADEIIAHTPMATCLECHNDKSPTFKPFCFKTRRQKIEHLDPRKPRTEAELKARQCGCGEDRKCVSGECGDGTEPAAGDGKGDPAAGKGK